MFKVLNFNSRCNLQDKFKKRYFRYKNPMKTHKKRTKKVPVLKMRHITTFDCLTCYNHVKILIKYKNKNFSPNPIKNVLTLHRLCVNKDPMGCPNICLFRMTYIYQNFVVYISVSTYIYQSLTYIYPF